MNPIIDALRNNWARYVLEAMVITFSIIGAFMLDNWKEEKQHRKEEQVILLGLKDEFLENLHDVDRNIKLNEGVINATYELINLIRIETWFEDQDRIDSLIASIYMFGTFDAHTGVTDELISGGKLSLIKDEKLKKHLTGWSGMLKDSQEDYEIRIQLYSFILIPEFLNHFTLANGDMYLDFSNWSDNYKVGSREKSPLKQNVSDLNLLRFENILWVHKMNNDFVTLNEQNLKEYIETTIELIESNIN